MKIDPRDKTQENPSGLWNFDPKPTYLGDNTPIDLSLSAVKINSHTDDTENWELIHQMPNLEELHLIAPPPELVDSLARLIKLKRLHIEDYRPDDLRFLEALPNIEELSLECMSRFSSFAPIGKMKKLKALRMYMIRGLNDYSGLKHAQNLQYLCIHSSFDYRQPIQDLDFIEGLTSLEYLILEYVRILKNSPASLPIARSKSLKYLDIPTNMFSLEDYALMDVSLPPHIKRHDPIRRLVEVRQRIMRWDEPAPLPSDLSTDIYEAPKINPEAEPIPPFLEALMGAIAPDSPKADAANENDHDGPIWFFEEKEFKDREIKIRKDYFYPLGKGARRFKAKSKNANAKVRAFIDKYETLKTQMQDYL